jgi:hypothetical protein
MLIGLANRTGVGSEKFKSKIMELGMAKEMNRG